MALPCPKTAFVIGLYRFRRTYILVHFNVLAKWTSSWPHSDKVQGEGRSIYADCIMGAPVNDCCCTRIDFLGKEGGNSEINLNFN